LFSIDTSGFTNAFTGSFTIAQLGNDLALQYTPITEPSTLLLGALAGLNLLTTPRRRGKC